MRTSVRIATAIGSSLITFAALTAVSGSAYADDVFVDDSLTEDIAAVGSDTTTVDLLSVDVIAGTRVRVRCSVKTTLGDVYNGVSDADLGYWEERGRAVASTSCALANIRTLTARLEIIDEGIFAHYGNGQVSGRNNAVPVTTVLSFPLADEPGQYITYRHTATLVTSDGQTFRACQKVRYNLFATAGPTIGRC